MARSPFSYQVTNTEPNENFVVFDVPGAGRLQISNECSHRTAGVEGFSIGVEWGQHGFAGGVIDKKEAVKLAQHILRTINLDELINNK